MGRNRCSLKFVLTVGNVNDRSIHWRVWKRVGISIVDLERRQRLFLFGHFVGISISTSSISFLNHWRKSGFLDKLSRMVLYCTSHLQIRARGVNLFTNNYKHNSWVAFHKIWFTDFFCEFLCLWYIKKMNTVLFILIFCFIRHDDDERLHCWNGRNYLFGCSLPLLRCLYICIC